MPTSHDPERPLVLAQVTVCAVTSVNVRATVRALEACLATASFAECLLLTDAAVPVAHPGIRVIPIPCLPSAAAYSQFMLTRLVEHVTTSHCLVVQWDGHILDASRWRPEFLEYDYIGASWPQFGDGHDVGNGGFSLRSRQLMEACRDAAFTPGHPEDVAIARTNRVWLEAQGLRFAPLALADAFSAERSGDPRKSFGYHGVFNMVRAIGVDRFWEIYRDLDERSSVWHDLHSILADVSRGPGGLRRSAQLIIDRLAAMARRSRGRLRRQSGHVRQSLPDQG